MLRECSIDVLFVYGLCVASLVLVHNKRYINLFAVSKLIVQALCEVRTIFVPTLSIVMLNLIDLRPHAATADI